MKFMNFSDTLIDVLFLFAGLGFPPVVHKIVKKELVFMVECFAMVFMFFMFCLLCRTGYLSDPNSADCLMLYYYSGLKSDYCCRMRHSLRNPSSWLKVASKWVMGIVFIKILGRLIF